MVFFHSPNLMLTQFQQLFLRGTHPPVARFDLFSKGGNKELKRTAGA